MEIGSFQSDYKDQPTVYKIITRNSEQLQLKPDIIDNLKRLFDNYKSEVNIMMEKGYSRRNSDSPRSKRKPLDSWLLKINAFIVAEGRVCHSPRRLKLA